MQLSDFGKQLSKTSGIAMLMNDLGRAMSGQDHMLMLGGGNPAHIPEVEALWRRRMTEILADGDSYETMLGNYDTPKGAPGFIADLVGFLNRRFGWSLKEGNIAILNGAQTALFCLLNMLTGPANGSRRKILFPLLPDYIGYADQCLDPASYAGRKPLMDFTGPHEFKYRIDFDHLDLGPDIAALCVSRPTNPTGNVLTDGDMRKLQELALARGIPLIVDNAYGQPFPDVLFTDATPPMGPNIILVMSLSKLGLPGTRTGIVVAAEAMIEALVSMNSVLSLANGNVGQMLVRPLLANDQIVKLCHDVIRPFYARKSRHALACIHEHFSPALPYYVHKSEGAFFLWLWFKDLPFSTRELYERLKQRGVLVVPGHYFFFGLESAWPHGDECIRLTFSQSDADVEEGIRIIADEVSRAYRVRAP